VKTKKFTQFAHVVKEARLRRGWSQESLDVLMGFKSNGQYISQVERGLQAIPARRLRDLSTHLETDIEAFIEALGDDYEAQIREIAHDKSRT